jgi:hypothetical protein
MRKQIQAENKSFFHSHGSCTSLASCHYSENRLFESARIGGWDLNDALVKDLITKRTLATGSNGLTKANVVELLTFLGLISKA